MRVFARNTLLLLAVYGILGGAGNAAEPPPLAASVRNFVLKPVPAPLKPIQFQDAAGVTHSLASFQGRHLLVNFWATWCAPCRQEMPSLDRLQQQLGGPDFQVVLISLDRAGYAKAAAFLAEIGVGHLVSYADATARAGRTLGVFGLPVTLLLDRRGDELGRLTGPAEWDSPEAKALIGHYLGRK